MAVARFATTAEKDRWDDLILAGPNGGEVWAGDSHLETKRFSGYRPHRVIVERPGKPSLAVGILAKRVPFLGDWWLVQAGPEAEDLEATLEASAAVADLARRSGAFLVKIEPRLGMETADRFLAEGYIPTIRRIPNESTVLVDLSGGEEAVRAHMTKKARNSINRGLREGVTIERVPSTDENCARLFDLLQETADGKFPLRPRGYFTEFWQRFARANQGQMFFAYAGGEFLAAAYAIRLGQKTSYKDGASVRQKQAYGVSHVLQWDVISWAIEQGATVHDMCGTPRSYEADDRSQGLYGVGKFKQSFSPEITDYVGAFELPLKPLAYRLWVRFGDPLARRLSLALKKDPYY